jgi:hypothetical protein
MTGRAYEMQTGLKLDIKKGEDERPRIQRISQIKNLSYCCTIEFEERLIVAQ